MSQQTNIEWCDSTFNPWIGCTKVSPACDDCYAARSTPARALKILWGAKEQRHRTSASNWMQPIRWNAAAATFKARHGRRQRVFCASLADVFDNQVPSAWRDDLWDLIKATPNLDWLILTKRIGNVKDMQPSSYDFEKTFPHVWIGATICNQIEADRDIPKLLAVPARVRFLSIEPLLEPISLTNESIHARPLQQIDWVIAGGESGPRARPMSPGWARTLRDQCLSAGVPFLFKQWGAWFPIGEHIGDGNAYPANTTVVDGHMMGWIGKKASGRSLDGIEHNDFPVASSIEAGADT